MKAPSPADSAIPKYQNVRERLRAQIKEQEYTPGARLPSQLELSRSLKVNHLTVRRAMQDLVREGLVVRRRGSGTFVVDRQHPPQIPGRNLRMGLLWNDSIYPHSMRGGLPCEITRGVLAAWGLGDLAPERPAAAKPEPTRLRWTSLDHGMTAECLGEALETNVRHPPLEAVRAGQFDGLLAISIIETAWLETLAGLGRPLVLVDFVSDRFTRLADQVFFDPLPGYRAAVAHFAELGLRRIHFLGSRMPVPAPSEAMREKEWKAFQEGQCRVDPDSFLRLGAYRQAMDECGLQVSDTWIHFDRSSKATCRLLGESLRVLPEAERPEALVCHGLEQAEAVREAFAEQGLILPAAGTARASQISRDGKALPILAPAQELGEIAAALVISRLQQPRRPFVRVGVPMTFAPQTMPGRSEAVRHLP